MEIEQYLILVCAYLYAVGGFVSMFTIIQYDPVSCSKHPILLALMIAVWPVSSLVAGILFLWKL